MVTDYNVSVKYLKEVTDVITYDTGLTDWVNIDKLYRNKSLRNKVVVRFDVTEFLSKYFELKTIREYRPVFMMIANGLVTDAEKFSAVLTQLVNTDAVFKKEIVNLFHSCPEESSLGAHIIDSIANVFKSVELNYRSFFRGKPEVVICVSDGWLYFSVEDTEYAPELPNDVKCEVLSYAKNWRGNFRLLSRESDDNLADE